MTLSVITLRVLGLIGLLVAILGSALIQVCEASIARHATDRPPESLDDVALVRAGAFVYSQSGCTRCCIRGRVG
jgi:hypothetical protein